jgi:hypothetical protein
MFEDLDMEFARIILAMMESLFWSNGSRYQYSSHLNRHRQALRDSIRKIHTMPWRNGSWVYNHAKIYAAYFEI